MATKKTPSQHETEKLKRLLADVEAKADSISQKFTEQWANIRKEIATGLANQNEYLRKYNDVLSATEKRAFLEAEMAAKQKEKIAETNEEIAQQEAIVKQQQAQLDTWEKGNADMSAAQEEQIKKGVDPDAVVFPKPGDISGDPKTDVVIGGKRISLKLPKAIQLGSGGVKITYEVFQKALLELEENIEAIDDVIKKEARIVVFDKLNEQ